MLMTTTCEWRGHAVANLSEMSSLEWFTTLDRDESQPRSALTPPGAPIYFRLRTLSHSTDTVHLANQIIVGCQAAGFCRSSTQAATGATGFPSPLQEGVWSGESPAVRCFCCRSGSRCAALLVPPLPVRSAVRRSPGRCVSLRETAVAAVGPPLPLSGPPSVGNRRCRRCCARLPASPCGLRATAPPFAALVDRKSVV